MSSNNITRKPIDFLIDMDGTICDWPAWFDAHVDTLYPHFSGIIPRGNENRTFDLWKGQPEDVAAAITHIFNYEGFYADIPEIEGAVEALRKLREDGHHVSLATAPWWGNPSCLEDKKNWVKNHLGEDWLDSLVISRDKTRIRGDYLIDDKPVITGHYTTQGHKPTWTHILFDQPYNSEIEGLRLHDWQDDWNAMYGHIEELSYWETQLTQNAGR